MRMPRLVSRLICLLAIVAAGSPQIAEAQSFDCSGAETEVEWAICNTPKLRKSDQAMAALLQRLKAAEARNPAVSREGEQLQKAWIIWARDQCSGDVGCLIKAYDVMLSTLNDFAVEAETLDPSKDKMNSIAPRCGTTQEAGGPNTTQGYSDSIEKYAAEVCRDKNLLEASQQIDAIVEKLRPKLTPSWRAALDSAQLAFPTMPYMCPPDQKLAACIGKAVRERLQDVKNFADNWDKSLPACKPAEVSIKDGRVGDAGMSKQLSTYLIEYNGSSTCQLRGYPTVLVFDDKGKPEPGVVGYTASTFYSNSSAAPLPVTLSPANKIAWFAVQFADACDSLGTQPHEAKLALPLSYSWLRTITFPETTCPSISVTPIEPISTLLSSVR